MSVNDSCGETVDLNGVLALSSKGGVWQLNCQAVVIRMGERFGEFGIDFEASTTTSEDLKCASKWNLCVYAKTDSLGGEEITFNENSESTEEGKASRQQMYNEVLSMEKRKKMVKLSSGTPYVAMVRCYNQKTGMWSMWSPPILTSSLNPVVGQIFEVGEDFANITWDRRPRDTKGITPEKDTVSTKAVSDIQNLELRVLCESDMEEVFCSRFSSGQRSHMLQRLHPGTAYIVLFRYDSLINTKLNWTEVGRFYTQAALEVALESCGENVFCVTWKRRELPSDTIGYTVQKVEEAFYQIQVLQEGVEFAMVDLPSSENRHRVPELSPGSWYDVSVRSVSKTGLWGCRSNTLKVRTAERPKVEVIAVGESFTSFSWSRQQPEYETKMEFCVQSVNTEYRQQRMVQLQPGGPKEFHVELLQPGTQYAVTIRTFLNDEWGLWTEPFDFTTSAKSAMHFVERGESFFTVGWPEDHNDGTGKFNIIVARTNKMGQREVLQDTEIERTTTPGFRVENLFADTMYEVQIRTWQRNPVTGYEGWGELSEPVMVRTMRTISLHLVQVGEDFISVVWHRGGAMDSENENSFIKYEIVVSSAQNNERGVLHKQVLDTTYTITGLKPFTTYEIGVRSCDEREQWGLWNTLKVCTLASVVTSIHEIGEDFVRLMWQRHDEAEKPDDSRMAVTDKLISTYDVFVYAKEFLDADIRPHLESGYGAGGNSDVTRYEVVSSDHTSLRVTELLPDREYVAVVRTCSITGKKGLWSKPIRFRTNSQFVIPVNSLSIGENYVHLVWSRDPQPIGDKEVHLGDMTVTGQQLRIHGVSSQYSKDHTLAADLRELKIYGLSAASAYTIQLRVCDKGGHWGLWSPPVYILTRGTILTQAVEVAEDYAVIRWERRKVPNPHNYPTGKGQVTCYHLRMYNADGIHTETFLGDGDCPYKVKGLIPNTYYCVELKANYNDEEWGMWSTPLWCLTMQTMRIQTRLISEEFCRLSIERPIQQRRLPSADGNRSCEDQTVVFGQLRPSLMLCVTTPILDKVPHTATTFVKPKFNSTALPPDAENHRLIYQTEIVSTTDLTEHTVPNLKSNTVYCVSVRSKLQNGEWGLWAPSLTFATVPTTRVCFQCIGENYLIVEWRRRSQFIPPVIDAEKVVLGMDNIGASRVRIREIGGTYQHLYTVEDSSKILRLDDLKPATTFAVSVQTYNDNYEWGVWSEESKARTVSMMDVHIPHISENSLWVSWTRKTDFDITDTDTYMNVNVQAKSYEVSIAGAGGFKYNKEMQTNALFFRGLQPDSVYCVSVRALFVDTKEWGQWSVRWFRTQPRLRVTFGNIGEHFAIVEWRRHLPRPLDANMDVQGPVAEAEDVVQQFRFKVQRVGDPKAVVYNLGPSVSSFRLKDLEPNSEYRVWMCAKGYEGVWGLWNEEARVRTLPKLVIEVCDMGEDYVKVRWQRVLWCGESVPDNNVVVRQVDGAVSGYEIRLTDKNGDVVCTPKATHSETSATVSALELNTLYAVEIRAKDTYNEWGLWSDAKRFVTLKAVSLNLLRFGETFIDVEWARCGVLKPHQFGARGSSHPSSGEEGEEDEEEDDETATTPTHFTLEVEQAENEQPFPEDVILPNETVTQWHIRFVCKRLFSGMPKEEEFTEFYAESDEVWRRIDTLLPDSYYTVFVRAKNTGNEWGHWSPPLYVTTYPLLKVEMDLVGETFINMSWCRPEMKDPLYLPVACFPLASEIHNYQVSIKPLSSEPCFREEDEPVEADGARVYETTQPSLRLGNLTSGTRYMVAVREQHVGDDGKAIEDSWGAFCEMCYLETSPPLKVLPVEIGEDYCLVQWIRNSRPPDAEANLFVTPHLEKLVEFEIHTQRLNDDALTVYEGQLALDNVLTLPPSSTQYHIESLINATIYLVQVRGKGESGTWGPWSKVMKFITQSRLLLTVQAVYETNFYVSWTRPLPSWAIKEVEDDGVQKSPCSPTADESPYKEVLLGDYSIEKYEMVVASISCSLERVVTLENTELSTSVDELEHNQIYSVCVRSLSQKQHWSMFSNKESVLTLQPMTIKVAHYMEDSCVLRWLRAVSDLNEFCSLLEKTVAEAKRQCDERERRDLYELKRRLQEMESRGEKVSGWIDQETREEHNAFLRKEALHHILLENIHLGDTENTAFHLQLFGEANCCPIIANHALVVQRSTPKKREKNKVCKKGCASTEANYMVPTDPPEESAVLSEGTLIDAELFSDVNEVVIQGLRNNAEYSVLVRSRNVRDEWQSWSQNATMHTFCPIKLEQSRFGEHYINLFWHRMEEARSAEMVRDMETYKELQSEFAQYAGQGDLEAKREGMSDKDHTACLSRLTQFKELHRRVTEQKHLMADGKGELLCDPNTPISSFQIRIIQESGDYLEYTVPNLTDGCAFTVTGLEPNCMYVCLLCPCYGEHFWGMWTKPLKFMTQNLIQLKLTYVGESFVDIEWHRMANKLPPLLDRRETVISSLFSEEEQIYQLRIEYENPETGEHVEEMRDMNVACNVFRVDGLRPDTKYTIAVREWDAKGDWGLWCSSRTCVTLPGMFTTLEDIGEDWAVVSWARYRKRIDYDNDMHVLQSGMQTVSVWLRVVELLPDPEEEDTLFVEDIPDADSTSNADHLTIGGFFGGKKQREGPLPPKKHPEEMEQLEGRYVLIQHFDTSVSEHKLTHLKPDRFYYVQVLSETTGGQLGMWSTQSYMLTKSKIVLSVERIDEQYIDIQWVRNGPHTRPGLDMDQVYVGTYETASYELEAEGVGLSLVTTIKPNITTFRLNGLSLDSVYISRVRSINTKDQISMWSDLLCAVTLKPVMVRPVQITEYSMIIEWGRLEQHPEDYPPTDTPLQMGSRVSAGYHLRVGQATPEGVQPLFERNFTGETQQLDVPELTPNSAYVVCARASNEVDEWGLWSEDRCVHTMQLLRGVIAAVGEVYVRLCWERPAPDVIIPANEDEDEEKVVQYPLLDQPEKVGPVYNSVYSHVVHYAILVRAEKEVTGAAEVTEVTEMDEPEEKEEVQEEDEEEDEGYRVIVSGDACTFTLPNLKADQVYNLSIHACYRENEEWGPFSESVRTSTYNLLSLEVKDAGEDYLASTWQRLPNRADLHTMSMGKVEETVCYEVGIYNFTEVSMGEGEESAYREERYIRSAFVPRKQRHCMVKELNSNHRYKVAVRRWYEPHQRFLADCPAQEPRTDDTALVELIAQRHAVPGAWSEPDSIVTLKDMVCVRVTIGENAFCVKWERDPRAINLPLRKNYTPKNPKTYHIHIDELTPDGTQVESSPDSFHVDELIAAPESTFTAEQLKPDNVYKVEVRCSCVDKIWGRWSAPLYIITQPKLQVGISNIGEDSAALAWCRHYRHLALPDGAEAVIGDNEMNDKFELEVCGIGFSYQLSKRFNGTRTTYNLKHLEANSLFSIKVRSSDSATCNWSLWSDKVHFATLKPLTVKVGLPAEQFVHVDWARELQAREDFHDMVDGPIVLGTPEVMAYHMCVFQTNESPAVAVVDKQFYPDIRHFRVHTLAPDTPYVVIVRACYEDSRWGLWSEEMSFHTQSLFELVADGTGENYVNVKWERHGGTRVTGVAQPTAYHMMLKYDTGVLERVVEATECSVTKDESCLPCYRYTGLEPGTNYAVAIQPLYGADKGMWSNAVNISTLAALNVHVQTIDGGVELHWGRKQGVVGFLEPPPPGPEAMPADVAHVSSRTVVKYQFAACRAEDADVVFAEEEEEKEEVQDAADEYQDADTDVENSTPDIPTGAPNADEAPAAEVVPEEPTAAVTTLDGENESEWEDSRSEDKPPGESEPAVEVPVALHATETVERVDPDPNAVLPVAEEMQLFKVVREIDAEEDDGASCKLMDLESDTRYLVRVRALDSHGHWGSWVDNFITTPPPAPKGLVLRKVNAQFCALQWKELAGHHNEYIYYIEQNFTELPPGKKSSTKPLDWKEVDTVDETVCPIRITTTIPSLRCRIRCQRKGDFTNPYSDYSEEVGVSNGTPPEPVTNLAVVALSRYGATLEWTPPPKPDSRRVSKPVYNIYLRKTNCASILIATVGQSTYTLNELTPDTLYVAQVVAENNDGVSYTNPMIRFTTKEEEDLKIYVPETNQPLGEIVDRAEEFREECRKRTGGDTDIPCGIKIGRAPSRPLGVPPHGGRRFVGGKQMMVMDGSEGQSEAEDSSDRKGKKGRKGSKGKKGSKGEKKGKKKGSTVKLPPI